MLDVLLGKQYTLLHKIFGANSYLTSLKIQGTNGMDMEEHRKFMSVAFEEALQGYNEGGVPVGAVMTKDGKIIARCVQKGS